MNNASRFYSALSVLLIIVSRPAVGQQSDVDTLRSRVLSIEHGNAFGPDVRQAAREFPVDEIVPQILTRLAATGEDTPSLKAKHRLWKALALLPNDRDDMTIANPARVAALTQALTEGPWEIQLFIINHYGRIAPEQRGAAAAVLNELIATSPRLDIVSSALQDLGLTRSLSPERLSLARQLMHLDYSGNPALQTTMQTPGLSGREGGGDPQKLQARAMLAVLSTYDDPAVAAAYLTSIPDDWTDVALVMVQITEMRYLLENADPAGAEAWMQEYLRRLCLPSTEAFRNRDGGYFFLLTMIQTYPDLEPVVCQWLSQPDASCPSRAADRANNLLDFITAICQ